MIADALSIRRVHLLGICGTAMASLAGLLRAKGLEVTGSDENAYPPMSTMLAGLGIEVRTPYAAANLPGAPDLVVVGNAIPRGNPELEEVLDRRLRYASMPETLRELLLRGRRVVCVSGTHGKTTTTALLAWLLTAAGRRPGFLIGGEARNFGASFAVGEGEEFVVEGDEYDTAYFDKGPKFLHYRPDVLILGNVEFDHADIYPDLPAIELQFRRLVNTVPRSGCVIAGTESPSVRTVIARSPAPLRSFGLSGDEDWTVRRVEHEPEGSEFTLVQSGTTLMRVHSPLSGDHNVRNALAAVAAGAFLGVPAPQLARAISTFEGVRRRLELRGEADGVAVVDDFGHHPTAVRETLAAARCRFPDRRIWAVFEPRSWTSRRRVHQAEYADALSGADLALLAPVYQPEKLAEAERLDPEAVAASLRARGRDAAAAASTGEILERLLRDARPGDVVLVLSNGAFDGLHDALLEGLRTRSRAR